MYEKYYPNYQKFIIELNFIPDEQISFYLKRKKCLKCQKNYPFKFDSFIHLKEITTKDITKELCYSCITEHKNCSTKKKNLTKSNILYKSS